MQKASNEEDFRGDSLTKPTKHLGNPIENGFPSFWVWETHLMRSSWFFWDRPCSKLCKYDEIRKYEGVSTLYRRRDKNPKMATVVRHSGHTASKVNASLNPVFIYCSDCFWQIPFFPLVKKDLTFIHFGNDSRVDGLVNFEKLRMIAKEVRQVTNMSRCDRTNDRSSSSANTAVSALNSNCTFFRQNYSCNASDSADFYTFLRSVTVCLSVCRLSHSCTLFYRDKILWPWVRGFLLNEGVKEGYPLKDFILLLLARIVWKRLQISTDMLQHHNKHWRRAFYV